MEKLIIQVTPQGTEFKNNALVRISGKVNALLEDVSKRSGRSKTNIANMMLEYAYDNIQFVEAADDGKEE